MAINTLRKQINKTQAYINLPLGVGISLPISFAVSIQSCITCFTLNIAS
jgi:hypothetical protein